jgi:hypothetical protein
MPAAPELVAQDRETRVVVVDHQGSPAAERASHCRVLRRTVRLRSARAQERQLADHRGADALAAVELDRAAHQLHELARDRQPETRAAEAPRGARVRLSERLKQCRARRRRDTDARVSHDGSHPQHFGIGSRDSARLDAQLDLAGQRELHRVADQVGEDLAQSRRIAAHPLAQRRRHEATQLHALRLGALSEHEHGVLHAAQQVELDVLERHLARLDLREVEDVVDDRQQGLARRADRAGEVALLRVELRAQQELSHRQHAVHRCADLVTHVGEKGALRAAGFFGGGARRAEQQRLLGELLLARLDLGHV